ncbi:MAG: queuosine precursor transporter [Bacteroidales bacterium]|nr:queuosine precursor transporter [Bacteroidales bacterium]
MTNELLIISSFLFIYGSITIFYRFFGKNGLLAFNVMATLLANIEVMLLVYAFGIEMTLGNVLFASTFLVTDILSENHGAKEANKAVLISTLCSIVFIFISQTWLLYTPSENDWASSSFKTIFTATPALWSPLWSSISFHNLQTYGSTTNGGTGAEKSSQTIRKDSGSGTTVQR